MDGTPKTMWYKCEKVERGNVVGRWCCSAYEGERSGIAVLKYVPLLEADHEWARWQCSYLPITLATVTCWVEVPGTVVTKCKIFWCLGGCGSGFVYTSLMPSVPSEGNICNTIGPVLPSENKK